jgi:hypothetical protein
MPNTNTALLDLTVAGHVLTSCREYRDTGASASLWEAVAPELLGQPISQILAHDLLGDGDDADAWDGVRRALARHTPGGYRPHGDAAVSRGLHDVVAVVGDVTAVVATVRAVAAPVASLVRRALDRRRMKRQEVAGVQIEVDLPVVGDQISLPASQS